MRAKLPIVASDIKGVRDLVYGTGKLYQYGDEDEYIKFVKTITIGKTEYDTDKYSIENVLKSNMEIYMSHFGEKEKQKNNFETNTIYKK
jgi:hypothetical protein